MHDSNVNNTKSQPSEKQANTAHIRREVKFRTAKWISKVKPEKLLKLCLHECKHWFMQTHTCRHPYMHRLTRTKNSLLVFPLLFFLLDRHVVENVCLCGSDDMQMFMWVLKKKMEKVWSIYSESQKATHRLLFIAPSWWNRENEQQLLCAGSQLKLDKSR